MMTANEWIREDRPIPSTERMTSAEDFEAACFVMIELEIQRGRELMLRELEGVV